MWGYKNILSGVKTREDEGCDGYVEQHVRVALYILPRGRGNHNYTVLRTFSSSLCLIPRWNNDQPTGPAFNLEAILLR